MPKLLPVAKSQDDMTASFASGLTVSVYCQALLNTNLNPPSDAQDWFQNFDRDLEAAKANANEWINSLGPEVMVGVPQTIIDFSNTFLAATDQVLEIITRANGEPTPGDVEKITTLLEALRSDLKGQVGVVLATRQRLQDFDAKLRIDFQNLVAGADGAQQALQADLAKIEELEAKIAEVKEELESLAPGIFATNILNNAGAVLLLLSLPAVLFGRAGSLFTAFGLAVFGRSTATAVVNEMKASQKMDELLKLQNELSVEVQHVAAFRVIGGSLGNLVELSTAAQEGLQKILENWQTLQSKLDQVVTEIKRAQGAQVASVVQGIAVAESQAAWQDLTQFATAIQGKASGAEIQVASLQEAA